MPKLFGLVDTRAYKGRTGRYKEYKSVHIDKKLHAQAGLLALYHEVTLQSLLSRYIKEGIERDADTLEQEAQTEFEKRWKKLCLQ